jgi:hypothetical protein
MLMRGGAVQRSIIPHGLFLRGLEIADVQTVQIRGEERMM